MKLKKGDKYTINNSNVIVYIKNVGYSCAEYQKVTTIIYEKGMKHVVEGPKRYKLTPERIKHWKKV